MKIILLDRSLTMVAYWQEAFVGTDVECICDDFAAFMDRCGNEVDCVVSPGNSYGLMDGGYDLALTRYFGDKLPLAVQAYIRDYYHGEQPVGASFLVSIPGSSKHLIHTPTMRIPSPIYDSMVVYNAMRSTLLEAKRHNVKTILIPAFGGKCGRLSKDVIAGMMRRAYNQISSDVPEKLSWDYALRDMPVGKMPEQLRPPLPESPDESVNL